MLKDTRAPVLLTRKRVVEDGIAAPEVRVVCLDSDWDAIAQESDREPDKRSDR